MIGMKVCKKCKEPKPLTEFHKAPSNTDGRHSHCKGCRKAYGKKWAPKYYQRNKKTILERAYKKRVEATDRLIKFLLKNPCVDCGERDPVVLEFDHRDSSKKCFTISQKLAHMSWELLQEEMAKCDVRCSNCHKLKTAKEQKWISYSHPLRMNLFETS